MYSQEERLNAGDYINSWIRYIRQGGDARYIMPDLDSIEEEVGGPSDVVDYLLRDLVGTTKYYFDQQFPRDCPPVLIDSFITVTSVVVEEVAGIDEANMRRLVEYLQGVPGAKMAHVSDPVAACFAVQALLAPTDDGSLWEDRRAFSSAYDMSPEDKRDRKKWRR